MEQQVADLRQALDVYTRPLAAGTADKLWRDVPECD